MKIIHLLPHPPAYEDYHDQRASAPISWGAGNGSWVGVWGTDWPDLLAREILKINRDFQMEIWQPDPRADQIFAHALPEGAIHRLFPAIAQARKNSEITSPALFEELQNQIQQDLCLLHLHGFSWDFIRPVLENIPNLPILYTFHGEIPKNLVSRHIGKNLVAVMANFRQHRRFLQLLERINHLTYPCDDRLDLLQKIYSGPQTRLTMGCDFNFWKPLDKKACREKLGLPRDRFIMLSASRLAPGKQLEPWLATLQKLTGQHDFLALIAGHGLPAYEKHLRGQAFAMLDAKKFNFTGHLSWADLLTYINAADLFVSTSASEGGPVVSMMALACGQPLFATRTGHVAGTLMQNNSGCVVGRHSYDQWRVELEKILSGHIPRILNIEIARQIYDWPVIAQSFLEIYKSIFKEK